MTTLCDVIDNCTDCPRYADDCDGDKHLDRYPTMHEYAEGKRINPKLTDLIRRADAIEAVENLQTEQWIDSDIDYNNGLQSAIAEIKALPSADVVQEWIPCSERLPSDDEIVNITWVNHNPPPYYADIEGKPFVASVLRYRDKWYWYSSVCQDLHQDFDIIDKDIEVIAWQPLPAPYKGGELLKARERNEKRRSNR